MRPLFDKVGLEWRGDKNREWDWHIVPGFSMAYSQKERELLADEAMDCFKKIYGYYPKTVASWLIDTYTVNYISEKYNVSAFAICRDQTEAFRVKTPVFRLLGLDPLHDYDKKGKVCLESNCC